MAVENRIDALILLVSWLAGGLKEKGGGVYLMLIFFLGFCVFFGSMSSRTPSLRLACELSALTGSGSLNRL